MRHNAPQRHVRIRGASTRCLLILCAAALSCAEITGGDARATDDVRCGSYCLYVALKGLGGKVASVAEVEDFMGPPPSGGYSMADLDAAARHFGFQTMAVETTLERLAARSERFACIAHVRGHHFLLIADASDGEVHVIDPPRSYTAAPAAINAIWDGKALLISQQSLEPEELVVVPLRKRPRAWIGFAVMLVLLLSATVICFRRRLT